jgi:hypothetical protein
MHDGQAQIRYRLDGAVREWGVGCDPVRDTDQTLKAHLVRWIPRAEFLGVCITRVRDGLLISDTRRLGVEEQPDYRTERS